MIYCGMLKASTRRDFLRTTPLAAFAAAVPAGVATAVKADDRPVPPDRFKLVPQGEFTKFADFLKTHPGNFNFFDNTTLPVTAVMTYEEKKAAKEFEWHEGRDHLLQVIEGSCVYQVGGTPQNGRTTRPGEWLAPTCEGATTLILHKGDWLIIPRGTPHKRTTDKNVTFFLISTIGALAPI